MPQWRGAFTFFFYSAAAISAKSNLSPIGNGSRGTLTSWFHSYHTHFKWIIVLCHNGNMTCCPHPFVGRSFKGLRINWQRLDIMSKSPIYFFFIGFETKPSKPLRTNISASCHVSVAFSCFTPWLVPFNGDFWVIYHHRRVWPALALREFLLYRLSSADSVTYRAQWYSLGCASALNKRTSLDLN